MTNENSNPFKNEEVVKNEENTNTEEQTENTEAVDNKNNKLQEEYDKLNQQIGRASCRERV